MKYVEKFINKICENNNYDELSLEIIKNGKESNINKILEEISNNTKLNEEEKKSYYNRIFDYVKEINEHFENKVKDVYMKGFKEASETIPILSDYSIRNNKKKNKDLENCLNDYIIKRLEQRNGLSNNEVYKKKVRKIEIEKNNEKMRELYSEIKDLENIDSYKVGFYDAMKLLVKEDKRK